MTQKTEHYDIAIIGGGSAGLTMAAVSGNLGYKVALFEKDKMGGDCLNTGCVPSKALLYIAKKKHGGAKISFKEAMQHVHDTVAHIAVHDSVERFESFGVNVIEEAASFVDDKTLTTPSGRIITARRIIISTGSRAAIVPIPGVNDVPFITNESVFEQKTQPKHLAVIGGGPIGLEMAQAFRHLGSDVTVYEAGPTLMGRDDPDAGAIIHNRFKNLGITVNTGAKIEKISKAKDGIKIHAGKQSVDASHLLMATGRRPNSENLGLENTCIETDGRGFIQVNDQHRTANKRVFAIGDVTGGAQFTHMAGTEASTVIQRIMFGKLNAKTTTTTIPWVTYTFPEVAQVGLTADQAIAKYGKDNVTVIKIDGSDVDRLVAEDAMDSFLKVSIVKGKPVGATGVGPAAGEWLSTWAFMISNGCKVGSLNKVIAPYPTMWEINKKAVSAYYKPAFYSAKTGAISRLIFRILG